MPCCAVRNCKIKTNINPRTGSCTSCDQCLLLWPNQQGAARDYQLAQRGVVIPMAGVEEQVRSGPKGILPKVSS